MAESDLHWNNFLADLSDHLTTSDVKKIKFQLDVPDGVGEDITDGLGMLEYCNRKSMIKKDDISKLYGILDLIGRKDLRKYLGKTEQQLNDMIQNEKSNKRSTSPVNHHIRPHEPTPNQPIQSSDEIIGGGNPQDSQYKMTSVPRGLCIIINNMFNNKDKITIKGSDSILKKRNASEKDRDSLKYLFTWLKFKVETYDNVSYERLKDILTSSRDDTMNVDSDCFVCCILSHGHEDGFYCNDGEPIKFAQVKKYFEGDNCPSLLGKPKLFFVQACQGENYGRVQPLITDGPTPMETNDTEYLTDSAGGSGRRSVCTVQDEREKKRRNTVFLPVDADFLFYLASTPGLYHTLKVLGNLDLTQGNLLQEILSNVLEEKGHFDEKKF